MNIYEIIRRGFMSNKLQLFCWNGCTNTSLIEAICKYRVGDMLVTLCKNLNCTLCETWLKIQNILSTSCISLYWKVPWRCGRMADYVECSASARTSYVLRLPYCRIVFNSAIRIFFVRTERSGDTLCCRLDRFLRPSVLWLVFSAHEFYLSKLCVFLATSCVGGINLDPQVTECISHDTLHI